MATLGLILFLPHFEAHLVSGKGISFQEFFFSTLATQIAVLPLLLYYMGEVSIVSLIVNVLVLPVVPFAMLCTFGAGMLVHVSAILATPFILLAHYALAYIIVVAVWFAGLPFATVKVPVFSPYVVPLLYAVMGFVYWRFTQKKEKKKDARVVRASSSDTPVLFR
jgi:competence protein ComEC